MLRRVPNYAFTIGYTNSSWTLKADMTSEYVARLLGHMATYGYEQVVPVGDPTLERRPLLDFGAGYVERVRHTLPQQGSQFPWTVKQNYLVDRKMFRGPIDDGTLRFSSPVGHRHHAGHRGRDRVTLRGLMAPGGPCGLPGAVSACRSAWHPALRGLLDAERLHDVDVGRHAAPAGSPRAQPRGPTGSGRQ